MYQNLFGSNSFLWKKNNVKKTLKKSLVHGHHVKKKIQKKVKAHYP